MLYNFIFLVAFIDIVLMVLLNLNIGDFVIFLYYLVALVVVYKKVK